MSMRTAFSVAGSPGSSVVDLVSVAWHLASVMQLLMSLSASVRRSLYLS